METIDAFGMRCPKPLMLVKKMLEEGHRDFDIRVDNEMAAANLVRLGATLGIVATTAEVPGGYSVAFRAQDDDAAGVSEGNASESADALSASEKGACDQARVATAAALPGPLSGECDSDGRGYAVFIGNDRVGEGDDDLGRSLMEMALYALSECGDAPTSLLFMNSGVKLVAGSEQHVVEILQSLVAQGTEVLACGTCLDFYGLKDSLAVGDVSNMFDILDRMRKAGKVISL